jgi:hypothetical protein
VNDDRPVQVIWGTVEWPGSPAMRHVGSEEDQVTGPVAGDPITYQTLSLAAHNQRKFVLRMKVPGKRESRSNPVERGECSCTWQFLTARPHAAIMKILTHFVNGSLGLVPMECIYRPTRDKTSLDPES